MAARLADLEALRDVLADPFKRWSTLYHVRTKSGGVVPFRPWPEQVEVYQRLHYRNIILKARQRGMTTGMLIFMLDRVLFNSYMNAGVIAHNREDAARFFEDIVKVAYDNLPEVLRRRFPARSDSSNELSFEHNGSAIRIGTSLRSVNNQLLHITEYGKICAQYPHRAREIRRGALNTVSTENIVTIESTAEGAYGDFYDKCTVAEAQQLARKAGDRGPIHPMEYRFFFFPWWRAPEYTAPALSENEIPGWADAYFDKLYADHGIELTPEQEAWYILKREELGEGGMYQEHPSYPREAFRVMVEGAIYAREMLAARESGRIGQYPPMPGYPVNTFWDIGRGDATSVWFHQRIGGRNRFFRNETRSGYLLPWWVARVRELAQQNGWVLGGWYFPHDMGVIEWGQQSGAERGEGLDRRQVAENLGAKPAHIVDRVRRTEHGIEMMRQQFPSCEFDEDGCNATAEEDGGVGGLQALEAYRYEFSDKLNSLKLEPLHDWASDPADAIRQFAQGYHPGRQSGGPRATDNQLSRSTRRRKAAAETDWRV